MLLHLTIIKIYYKTSLIALTSVSNINVIGNVHIPGMKPKLCVFSVCEDLLEAVGGSRRPEEPLCLAVVWSVQRVDVVRLVLPQITPQRVSPLTQSV